jgi:hypothetical protein
MIWPMKARSVLLGRDAAEANDQGVQRGADEVKDDEVLFSIPELMISTDCKLLPTWDKSYRQDTISYTRIPPFYTTSHAPQPIKLVKTSSFQLIKRD